MRLRLAAAAALLILAPGCAADRPDGAAPRVAHLAEASAASEAEMRRQEIPGMALVVMEGDRVALARGFGLESTARPDPVTPDTVFMYNSISKQFVAAAVMKLAEQGRLSLDDAVSRHLPEWGALPAQLRIRHLLSHMSGLRDGHVQPALGALYDRPGTSWAEFAAAARETPSDAPPGERWSYANINYVALQLIVERLTGRPLADGLAGMFFRPLGLASVRVCEPQPGAARGAARGHVPRNGTLAGHDPEPVHLFVGPGGLCGSALDLARWTRALATGRVVTPASYRLMAAPAPTDGGEAAPYGFALALVRPDGVRRIGHGGYGGGMGAQAAYYPHADLTLVVMGNRFAFPESIERKVVRRLLDLPGPPARDLPLTAEQRRRFAGAFDVGVHGWHPKVEERAGRLWLVLPGPPIAFPLAYRGDGLFADARDPDGWQLLFSPDARELRLTGMGLMTWYGRRVVEPGA